MAIADVPVPPLSIVGGFQTLTDTLTACCLCPKGGDVGCHHLLAKVILSSGVVHEEHAVVNWFEWFVVHALIIGGEGGSGVISGHFDRLAHHLNLNNARICIATQYPHWAAIRQRISSNNVVDSAMGYPCNRLNLCCRIFGVFEVVDSNCCLLVSITNCSVQFVADRGNFIQ